MKHFRSLFFLAVTFATTVHASEHSKHTGYWKENTPDGEEFNCSTVSTESDMEYVLQRAGWNMDAGLPLIDWQQDEATIIAPSKSNFSSDAYLAFYGLVQENDRLMLDYGWEIISSGPISSSPGAVTFGSRAPSYPETIVVSYRREIKSGLKLYCRNINPLQ